MSELFNVVFAGQIAQGADPAAVRANIARLFKVNDATLEKLFSGQRIAVKKGVDQAGAMKLRALMKQAGANASIERCAGAGDAPAPSRPAVPPVAPRPVAAPVPAGRPSVPAAAPAAKPVAPVRQPTMAERIAAMAAEDAKAEAAKPKADAPPPPADVERAETWKMFPPGSLLSEIKAMPAAPLLPNVANISLANLGSELLKPEERKALVPAPVALPDISGLTLAPEGSSLIDEKEKTVLPAVQVDIADLSMAPANTELLKADERRVVVPVVVDVSGITVAPPGADLEQIREEKVPVNPDISRLKMA